jgi:hypothetical protein
MPIFSEGRIVLGSLAAVAFWLFVGLPLLEARDQMNCDTVPQWLGTLPQWLIFAGVVVAYFQLRHYEHVRETENFLSVSDSTIAHNARFLEGSEARKVVEMLEGLNVPASEPASKTYWATRGVHFSHMHLVWRVWELAGQPGRGQPMEGRYDGWERFAREIIAKKLRGSDQAVESGGTKPEDLAASDLWRSLHSYEAFPTKFVEWLDGLLDR